MRRLLIVLAVLAWAAGAMAADTHVRITLNPYAEIDWATTNTYKASFHEHTGTVPDALPTDLTYLNAVAAASYDVIPYCTYSGYFDASSEDYLDSYRHSLYMPLEDFLTPAYMQTQKVAGRVVLYTSEEITSSSAHMTSVFFDQHIDDYGTSQGALDLITAAGGVAYLNHPTNIFSFYAGLDGLTGTEIYNSFYLNDASGWNDTKFVPFWDTWLSAGGQLWGFASNDWLGPGRSGTAAYLDSGKNLIFADTLTEASIEAAVRAGQFFAVKDIAAVKNGYPDVTAVSVAGSVITVTSDSAVSWISHGDTVGASPALNLAALSTSAKYVRALSTNSDGSITYLQPFYLEAFDGTVWTHAPEWGGEACASIKSGGVCYYTIGDDTDSGWITVGSRGKACLIGDASSTGTGAVVQIRQSVSAESAAGSFVVGELSLSGVWPGDCVDVKPGRVMVDVLLAERDKSGVVEVRAY